MHADMHCTSAALTFRRCFRSSRAHHSVHTDLQQGADHNSALLWQISSFWRADQQLTHICMMPCRAATLLRVYGLTKYVISPPITRGTVVTGAVRICCRTGLKGRLRSMSKSSDAVHVCACKKAVVLATLTCPHSISPQGDAQQEVKRPLRNQYSETAHRISITCRDPYAFW
jgi:hypothetical protein